MIKVYIDIEGHGVEVEIQEWSPVHADSHGDSHALCREVERVARRAVLRAQAAINPKEGAA